MFQAFEHARLSNLKLLDFLFLFFFESLFWNWYTYSDANNLNVATSNIGTVYCFVFISIFAFILSSVHP